MHVIPHHMTPHDLRLLVPDQIEKYFSRVTTQHAEDPPFKTFLTEGRRPVPYACELGATADGRITAAQGSIRGYVGGTKHGLCR